MGKKSTAQDTSAANKKEDADAQHPLQAVVCADAAELRFRPLTLEKPRCLLPLANIPMIEYTLEFLAVAGVQEIFVFCKSHADQIKAYIAHSKWSKPRSQVRIHCILAPQALGVGDVLREVDGKGLIHTDFILVSGNCVANMKLDKVLEEHRARKEELKDSIMTMVMKRASGNHRTRALGEGALVVVDPKNAECVHFELLPEFPSKQRLHMDPEVFKRHPTLQIHNDLMDCQVDICSVEVPALFTENFDYQDIRRDFVRGILESDLLGKTIHVHIISDEYAARVRSTQTYDAIAKDIMGRWTFPMVPDSNVHEGDSYHYSRENIYKEDNVVLSRSCVLGKNVVIGDGTEIGENTTISNSTIGRNCRIGANVTIENSYIWNDVIIESDCTIDRSIVADSCVLQPNVHIERGCVLSFNVVLGPEIRLPAFTKLTRTLPDAASNSFNGPKVPITLADKTIIGDQGIAYIWHDEWDDEADDEQDPRNTLVNQLGYVRTRHPSIRDGIHSDDAMSMAEDASSSDDDDDVNDGFNFLIKNNSQIELDRSYNEVKETIKRSILENHTVENAALEMNSLKLACNITFHDLRAASVPILLDFIKLSTIQADVNKVFGKWGPLLARFVDNEEDELDLLSICLVACTKKDTTQAPRLFVSLLKYFYESDTCEPENISKWYSTTGSWAVDECTQKVAGSVGRFVEWMEESEEEQSEDEESVDESDTD